MKSRLVTCGAIVALLVLFIVPVVVAAAEEAPTPAPAPASASSDPLIRVLVSKGVISAEEARFVGVGTAADQRDKLVILLREKGLLSTAELDELRTYRGAPVTPQATLQSATLTTQAPTQPSGKAEQTKPAPPKVVPGIAPLRVMSSDPPKREGLIPDIKMASGARIKFYGFLKASAVYDTSSPYGNDFPLPGFLNIVNATTPGFDTGPNGSPEFHIKARAARFGTNFEWPDISENWTLTGKFEYDWEGNFSRANNRNISSIRSNMASLRVAYARMDYKPSATNDVYFLAGQDWTPFASSSLPNLFESTGLGISFGTLYERAPQFRVGWIHQLGGARKWSINPDFAIVVPAFGIPAANISDQLGYGERQGPDSARPEVQGRVVVQWQLDKAAGVAPAQFIVSGTQAQRKIIFRKGDIPVAFATMFPNGTEITSNRWGYTAELQLPTRWFTLVGKYYSGADLRFYFAGGLFSTYNDFGFLTGQPGTPTTAAVASVDGSTALFATSSTLAPIGILPQRPVRAQGGFINLGLPLGRLFHADPAGRNAGWQMYLHYGLDDPKASDVRKSTGTFAIPTGATNQRGKNDLAAVTLNWKFNQFVTFGLEESYYRSRTINGISPTGCCVVNGRPARSWHDLRTEFGPIFTF
jgi:hypothetical protein